MFSKWQNPCEQRNKNLFYSVILYIIILNSVTMIASPLIFLYLFRSRELILLLLVLLLTKLNKSNKRQHEALLFQYFYKFPCENLSTYLFQNIDIGQLAKMGQFKNDSKMTQIINQYSFVNLYLLLNKQIKDISRIFVMTVLEITRYIARNLRLVLGPSLRV